MKTSEEKMVLSAAMKILGSRTSAHKKRTSAANAVKGRRALAVKLAKANQNGV